MQKGERKMWEWKREGNSGAARGRGARSRCAGQGARRPARRRRRAVAPCAGHLWGDACGSLERRCPQRGGPSQTFQAEALGLRAWGQQRPVLGGEAQPRWGGVGH